MPNLSQASNQSQVEAWSIALLGQAIGATTYAQVNTDLSSYGGLAPTLNAYYNYLFGNTAVSTVATTLLNNMNIVAGQNGLSQADVTAAQSALQTYLGGYTQYTRGAAIQSWLSAVSTYTTATVNGNVNDYAAAVVAINTANTNAETYITSGAKADVTSTVAAPAAQVTSAVNAAAAAPAQTFNLTTGIDSGSSFVGGAGNDSFIANSSAASGTMVSTFNALDSIDGGAGTNTLSVNDSTTGGISLVAGAVTVKNIQTATFAVSNNLTLDTTQWTGLTNLTVTGSTGTGALTSAATTAVTDTNTLLATTHATTATNTIDGGSTVTVTETGTATGANLALNALIIGGTTAPTGNIIVTSTQNDQVTAWEGGAITATGAAGVAITDNVTATKNNSTGNGAGAISATSNTNTAPVTVTYNYSNNQTDNAASSSTTSAITASGGSTITVAETVTATTAALAAMLTNAATITQGIIIALDGGTGTTQVTVGQTVKATAAVGTAATAATAASVTAGASGYSAVTSVAAAAAAALIPATLGVVAGAVHIAGATDGTALGNASSSITTASITNYGTAASYVNSTALTTLTLAGTGSAGALTVYNPAASPFRTLQLNLNKFSDAANATVIQNVTTLNVTTGGSGASSLTGITDTSLTTLNINGTQVLTLPLGSSVTTIAVSGAAGFADTGGLVSGLTASGTGLSFTTTSSGKITATLHANGLDSFVGSTGQDVITITADQTVAVTGGSGTTDEIILSGASAATWLTAGKSTLTKVTGFETLGVNHAGANGTYDLSLWTGDTFTGIDVQSGNSTTDSFINVAKNTSLTLVGDTTAAALLYQGADAQSVTGNDTVTLNLKGYVGTGTVTTNGATTALSTDAGTSAATRSVLLEDTNQVGITTLNVVTSTAATGITALVDSGLSALNVSGSKNFNLGILDEGVTAGGSATAATSFTINNTLSAASTVNDPSTVYITTFKDSALGTLTFTGTGNTTIGTLGSVGGSIVSISNTGTGTAAIGAFADASLRSLTLTNGVALGPDGQIVTTGATTDGTSGAAEYVTYTSIPGLALGQSLTIDGLTVTAQTALTGTQVAAAFAAGATSGGNYTVSGAIGTPATWTATAAFSNPGSTTTITLTNGANVNVTNYTVNPDQAPATGSTAGVTVSASTDNAHINLNLTGAVANATDSITVGNGNNYITDGSSAGTVNVTVGTGANYIDLHTGASNATYAASVTLGTHTNTASLFNTILLGVTNNTTTAYSAIITGAATGDVIAFTGDVGQSVISTLSTAEQTAITALSTLATAISTAFTDAHGESTHAAHNVLAFTYGGATYVINDAGDNGSFDSGTDAVIKLVGTHTIAAVTSTTAATVSIAS